VFFNFYTFLYLVSPKTSHRIVGYLEEEAIHSYSSFLREIDNGNIPNKPAAPIAIQYYHLPADATLRDVVLAVRADVRIAELHRLTFKKKKKKNRKEFCSHFSFAFLLWFAICRRQSTET
jgi:hypothetical protein